MACPRLFCLKHSTWSLQTLFVLIFGVAVWLNIFEWRFAFRTQTTFLALPQQANSFVTASRSQNNSGNFSVSPVEYVRTGILVELSPKREHVAELHGLLHASWVYVNSLRSLAPSAAELMRHPQIQKQVRPNATVFSVQYDLLIFCEQASCNKIPADCRPLQALHDLQASKSKPEFRRMNALCFYHELDEQYEKRAAQQYNFLTSLMFTAEEPCRSVVPYYDYVMRTDADALLTPMALFWVPHTPTVARLPAAFGEEFMGSEFTSRRLERVARKLGLKHAKLHHMQSTWYVDSKYFNEIASYAVNLTLHFYTKEFTRKICKKLKKQNNGTKMCEWPHWHDGVSSLYGSNLAINHVLYDEIMRQKQEHNVHVDEWKTDKLDCWDNYPLHKKVQLHIVLGKHDLLGEIQQAQDRDAMAELCANRKKIELRDFGDIHTAVNAKDYASMVWGRSLRDACSVFMLPYSDNNDHDETASKVATLLKLMKLMMKTSVRMPKNFIKTIINMQ